MTDDLTPSQAAEVAQAVTAADLAEQASEEAAQAALTAEAAAVGAVAAAEQQAAVHASEAVAEIAADAAAEIAETEGRIGELEDQQTWMRAELAEHRVMLTEIGAGMAVLLQSIPSARSSQEGATEEVRGESQAPLPPDGASSGTERPSEPPVDHQPAEAGETPQQKRRHRPRL